jgi:hypothetical protein
MTLGRSATSRRGDTCTCGQMGSTCRPEWKRPPNACWCWPAQHPKARRNSLASRPASVRARGAGASFSSTSSSALEIAPRLADGALGLWKAIEEVFPSTRHQLLLGSQDRQPAEHGRSRGPGQHEGRPSRDLHRADPLLLNPLRSRRALY